MATTPMDIRRRPFSVEPFTKLMLPDGIFDTAIFKQYITCYYTNTSAQPLKSVNLYLESVGDAGIVPVPRTFHFDLIPPGASVRVYWLADFRNATPGKKLVSFKAQAEGTDSTRQYQKIFVSRTTYDENSKTYTCEVEEGSMRVLSMEMIGPKADWRTCKGKLPRWVGRTGPWIPAHMKMAVTPNPPYPGLHGDLPFSDPWWKVVAWIVAGVAALVALVAAAKSDDTAYFGFKGEFDEVTGDIQCCEPDFKSIDVEVDWETVAGVASAIATTAAAVGMSDAEDPWWRGQTATLPADGELTVQEVVDAKFSYPEGPPNAGEPFKVDISWGYERVTTGNNYTHNVSETQTNIHVSKGMEIHAPATHNVYSGPLTFGVKFLNANGDSFVGEQLYAIAALRSPQGRFFVIGLQDDGIQPDEKPNDGIYTGSLDLMMAYKMSKMADFKVEGDWRIYVFAQDINNATPDMLPEVAAQHIGGFMVASSLKLTFDPSLPCPLKSQATVAVTS